VKVSITSTIEDIKKKQDANKSENAQIDGLLYNLTLEIEKLKNDQDIIRKNKLYASKDGIELQELEQREKETKQKIKKLNDELGKSKIIKELNADSELTKSQLETYKNYLINLLGKSKTQRTLQMAEQKESKGTFTNSLIKMLPKSLQPSETNQITTPTVPSVISISSESEHKKKSKQINIQEQTHKPNNSVLKPNDSVQTTKQQLEGPISTQPGSICNTFPLRLLKGFCLNDPKK